MEHSPSRPSTLELRHLPPRQRTYGFLCALLLGGFALVLPATGAGSSLAIVNGITHPAGVGVSAARGAPVLPLKITSLAGRHHTLVHSVGSAIAMAHEARRGRLWIATSAHLLPIDSTCRILVEFPRIDGSVRSARAKVRWRDRKRDLALLTVAVPEGGLFDLARRPPRALPPSTSEVVALGFPDPEFVHGDGLRDTRGSGRRLQLFVGKIVEQQATLAVAFRHVDSPAIDGRLHLDAIFLHTARVAPGSSGGPLLDPRGALLGMHVGSLDRHSGKGCHPPPSATPCVYVAVSVEPVWNELERRISPDDRMAHASVEIPRPPRPLHQSLPGEDPARLGTGAMTDMK